MKAEVDQSCLTLCDPMDCRQSGYSVHGKKISDSKQIQPENVFPDIIIGIQILIFLRNLNRIKINKISHGSMDFF